MIAVRFGAPCNGTAPVDPGENNNEENESKNFATPTWLNAKLKRGNRTSGFSKLT